MEDESGSGSESACLLSRERGKYGVGGAVIQDLERREHL